MSSKFVPAEFTASCEKALEEIANRARVRLFEESKIDVKFGEVLYTAGVGYIQETAAYLRRHPDEVVNIYNLVQFSTVRVESETGEKAGNIVPKVELLDFLQSAESHASADEIKYTESCDKALEEIANHARVRIFEENKVDLKRDGIVYKCCVLFIQEIAAYLLRHPNEEIEIASLIKFRVVKTESESGDETGNISAIAELGERFKLGVKNDEATEEDEDEENYY